MNWFRGYQTGNWFLLNEAPKKKKKTKNKKQTNKQTNKQTKKGEGILALENRKIENLQIQCLIMDLQITFSYPPSSASWLDIIKKKKNS